MTPVREEKKSEKLHPNHGVDVETMEVDELGDTIASQTLKQIIRSMAARKTNADDKT